MFVQILQRIATAFLLVLGAGLVVSGLLSLVPDTRVALSTAERFVQNLETLLTFDYARTVSGGQPVGRVVLHSGWRSLVLIASALLLIVLLGVPLGLAAASRPANRWLQRLTVVVQTVSSVPVLVLAFLVRLLPLPIIASDSALTFLCMAATLAVGDSMLADVVRLTRDETRQVLTQPYIRAVRARNGPVARHLYRSLLAPITTLLASKVSYLIGGAVVVEFLFTWPGLGYEIILAVQSYVDPPLVLAITMLFVALIVTVNLVSEVITLASDPRLRQRTT